MKKFLGLITIITAFIIIWACSDLEHSNPFDSSYGDPAQLTKLDLTIEKIDRIKLVWDDDYYSKDSNYTFQIDRKVGESGTWQEKYKIFKSNTTFFTDSAAGINQMNYYRVKVAYDENISEPIEAGVNNPFNPPSNIITNRKDIRTIQISWADNSNGEDGFRIDRFSAGVWHDGFKTVGQNIASWTDSSAVLNDSIRYRVCGFRKTYSSLSVATQLIDNLVPAPSNLTIKQNDVSTFELNWADNSIGEEGFIIQRSIDGGAYSQIASLQANTTTYTDNSVSKNKSLSDVSYRVMSFYGTYQSDYAETASEIDFPAPGSISYEKLSISSIKLNWSDNSLAETGFKIEKKIGAGSWAEYATVGANITTWTDTAAEINQNLQYRIYGYKGTNTSPVTESSVIDNAFPAPSSITYTKISISSLKIDWLDNSVGEDGFKIDRSVDGTWTTAYATVAGNIKTYTDSNAPINKTVIYRVYAYKSSSVSASVSTLSINNTFPAPTNPIITQLAVNSVKIDWTDNSTGEDGFKIDKKSTTGVWTTAFASVGASITTYTDTAAAISDSLQYRIYGYKGTTYSTYAYTSASDLTFPPPTNVTDSSVSIISIKLNWADNSTGETGFKIDRSVDGGAWGIAYGTVGENVVTWTDANAPINKNIQYRIYGYTATDASSYAYSNTIANTFPAPVLNTVTQQTVSSFKLDWSDNSTGEEGFKIERKIDDGTYAQIASVGANVITYTDSSINKKGYTTVYYRIRAFKGTDYSVYSEKTQLISFPAPTNINYTKTSISSITVTWADNSNGEDGFKIDKKVGSSEWILTYGTASANAVSWLDSNAEPNTSIQYRVYAYKGSNSSTANYSATIDNTFPAPLNISTEKLTISSIKVNWTDNSTGETGFIVDRKIGVDSWAAYDTTAANAVTWTDNNAVINVNLQYRIKGYKDSYYSNYLESSQISNIFPAPTNLTLTQVKSKTKATSIKLDWTDNSNGEDGFKISKKDEVGNWNDLYTVGSNIKTWTDTNATISDSLAYRVKGYKGTYSSGYTTADVSALTFPPPSNLTFTKIDLNSIRLNWTDNSTGEDGFKIDKKIGDAAWTVAYGTVAVNAVTWTDDNADVNQNLQYRVYSYSGPFVSNFVETTLIDNTFPAPTNLTTTQASITTATIAWTDNSTGEEKFEIERKLSADATYLKVGEVIGSATTTKTYSDTTVVPTNTYDYRVKGVLGTNSSAYITKTGYENIFPAPTNLAATVESETSIKLAWTDNSIGEEGFKIDRKVGSAGTWTTDYATVGSNEIEFTDTGLTAGIIYYYKVRGYCISTYSYYTNEATKFIPDMSGFVLIPIGNFNMGQSGIASAEPEHIVNITKEYYLSKTELTQKEWADIMGTNPASGYGIGDNFPVYSVSWYSALVYCNKRSIADGLSPCYSISGSTDPATWGSIPASWNTTWNAVVCDFDAKGYRIPTEAEWEYAAQHNDNRTFPWGETEPTNSYCNFSNYVGETTIVGNYPSGNNSLGLSDMAGNVEEWVWDWYNYPYPSSEQIDPTGPVEPIVEQEVKIARGGNWGASPSLVVKCAQRRTLDPFFASIDTGLRIARTK
ncbi:MAG: SUMF1/EgtB/PvdO family nonheme iron enzyme [Candidatus Delongbacteria bacterium]|nr:SUMF1/EgtB/PvdO family nonheme iron enzyme [Candidatus Delongbacteria bacterium]